MRRMGVFFFKQIINQQILTLGHCDPLTNQDATPRPIIVLCLFLTSPQILSAGTEWMDEYFAEPPVRLPSRIKRADLCVGCTTCGFSIICISNKTRQTVDENRRNVKQKQNRSSFGPNWKFSVLMSSCLVLRREEMWV